MKMVWIQICHFVEFEKSNDGTWTWKYVENSEENISPVYVSNDISYLELYNVVRELVKLDDNSYLIECMSLNPKMTRFPVPPVKIDSNDKVKWYLSICEEHPLCVTLVKKIGTISENVPMDGQVVGCSDKGSTTRERVEVECVESVADIVQNDDNVRNAYEDGNFVNWDTLNVIEESPVHEDVRGIVSLIWEDHETFSTQDPMVQNASCSMSALPCPSSVRIPESVDFQCNNLFPTKKDLIAKLLEVALTCHFEFRVVKSTKTLYVVACIENNCNWRLRAVKIKGAEIFEVRKYLGIHTCSMSVRRKDHKHATYTLIGKHISENYRDVNRIYRPKDIVSDIRRKFGITISYTKAFMAKRYGYGLIRGWPEESYAKLPQYCYILEEKNPGTLTFIETSVDEHFKYFFMALGPCIRGFRSSIRRVISVDGTFLTARYGGTLLIATSQDANFQIYPLAFAIVDSENSDSWNFFFRKLREITGDTSDLVIVSDRGTSIPGAFQEVFEHAHHGYCNYHLLRNLKTEFPRLELDGLFWATAEAYSMPDFETNMAALCSRHEGIRGYLERAGLHHWARAHFQATRFNIMTTNNAESMNSLLKNARDFPILGLIEHIRETLQRWFHERRVRAENCSSFLSPPMEEKMCTRYDESNGMEVSHVSPTVLQVVGRTRNHVVYLEEGKCTCKKFEMDQFPCAHAIAAIRFLNDNGYRFCSKFYTSCSWKDAYSKPIYPLPSENDWIIPEEVKSRIVLPPLSRHSRGRPAKERKKSAGEPRKKPVGEPSKIRKCSKCSKPGHTRSKCKEDTPQ